MSVSSSHCPHARATHIDVAELAIELQPWKPMVLKSYDVADITKTGCGSILDGGENMGACPPPPP